MTKDGWIALQRWETVSYVKPSLVSPRVGDRLDTWDGMKVGLDVGGRVVGTGVGARVWPGRLGVNVGEAVEGREVGAKVGTQDGMRFRSEKGGNADVGRRVGTLVGRKLGAPVGREEGALVGVVVGV